MSGSNDQLRQLLRQYHDIEPAPDFEAAVRRRLRHQPARRRWDRTILAWWLEVGQPPRPVLAVASALAAALLIGTWSGLQSTRLGRAAPPDSLAFLPVDSLTASYLRLTEDDQ